MCLEKKSMERVEEIDRCTRSSDEIPKREEMR